MAEKSKSAVWLNTLMSALDPEIRRMAERLATLIPRDSVLRREVSERILGAIKGVVEVLGAGMPPAARTLLEKLTDFGDFFSSALYGRGGKTEATEAVSGWKKKFFCEAERRLRRARNPQAEYERLKNEFAFRKKLLDLLEAEIEKKPDGVVSTEQEDIRRLREERWWRVREAFKKCLQGTAASMDKAADRLREAPGGVTTFWNSPRLAIAWGVVTLACFPVADLVSPLVSAGVMAAFAIFTAVVLLNARRAKKKAERDDVSRVPRVAEMPRGHNLIDQLGLRAPSKGKS